MSAISHDDHRRLSLRSCQDLQGLGAGDVRPNGPMISSMFGRAGRCVLQAANLWNGPPLFRQNWIVGAIRRGTEAKNDADRGDWDRPRQERCSVVGLDAAGRVVLRRRVSREGVVKLAAGLPCCVMAMEACCGPHHLGRVLRKQEHQVRLMSPEYVRPYVKAQKNDDRDAEAIAEAATRPTMRFVELKSETQLRPAEPTSCPRPAGE